MAHTPASLLAASAGEAGKNLGDVFALLDEPMTAFQRIDLLVRVPDGLFRQRQTSSKSMWTTMSLTTR